MYGVCDRALNLFESYLSNRKQTCKVNNIFSEMRQTKTGVPQGSNRGPLLFLTYANDLPNCLGNASASMFPDDTNITATGQTVLQTNLNSKLISTRRLHGRSLRLPTRRKWAQSGYLQLCTTPSTAQAGADAGFSWS